MLFHVPERCDFSFLRKKTCPYFPTFSHRPCSVFPGLLLLLLVSCMRHVTLEGSAASHPEALSEPFSLKSLGDELRFMFIVRVLGRVHEGAHPDEMPQLYRFAYELCRRLGYEG
jgi:hypothetical protein